MKPHLWRVLEEAGGDEAELRRIVSEATAEQLILLNRRFGITVARLRDLPAFRDHAGTDREALARWVLTQGKKAWLHAQQDPSSLPARAPADALDVPGVLADVYQHRFGGRIPDQEPDPRGRTDLGPDAEWETRAWELIDVVAAGIPMHEAVSGYCRSELVRLFNTMNAMAERVLTNEVRQYLGEDPEDADWRYVTEWVLTQGRDAYEAMLANPTSIPRDPPLGTEHSVLLQLDDVYIDRYGESVPALSGEREEDAT